MTMERRHFALIADAISTFGTHLGPLGIIDMTTKERASIAHYFVGVLRTTNPNFDRERFLKACGVEQ